MIGDLPLGNGSHVKNIHVLPKLSPDLNFLQNDAVLEQEDCLVWNRGFDDEISTAGTDTNPTRFTVLRKDSARDYIAIPVLNDDKFTTVQNFQATQLRHRK